MSFTLEDVIAPFRAMESNEDAIPILGDEDAMKCLAAWAKTDQLWRKPKKRAPVLKHNNHAAVWSWVDSGWHHDIGLVAVAAGLSQRIAAEKIAMLVVNRLIYPDGSMSKAARTSLNIYVAEKLGIKSKPATKPRRDDNEN